MAEFCYYLLANGVLASGLALAIWCASRWVTCPAVLHLLWVLVLLRLLMPPVMTVDVSPARKWVANTVATSDQQQEKLRASISRWEMVVAIRTAIQKSTLVPTRSVFPNSESLAASEASSDRSSLLGSLRYVARQTRLLVDRFSDAAVGFLFVIWSVGAVAFLVFQVRAAILFHSSVKRKAYSSRVWQRRSGTIAKSMGIGSCPEIRLVRATVSPMLWGFGFRTKLLFPEKLLENLNTRAQNTLIAHELAHYRRGDQWVRLLELLATICFWWHPVLWWAKNEIERAEEHCCDAMAVRQSNGRPRTYAEALLATIDFVSAPTLPPVASAVSHSNFLRERLQAIMVHPLAGGTTMLPDSYPSVLVLAALILIPCPAFWSAAIKPAAVPAVTCPSASVSVIHSSSRSTLTSADINVHPIRLNIDESNRAIFTNADAGVEIDFGVGVVASSSFSQNGELLAVGTMDGQARLVSCRTGETVRQFEIGNAAINSVSFSSQNDILAVGTRDGICQLVGLKQNNDDQVTRRRRGWQVSSARFSADGRYAAVVWRRGSKQSFEVWDLVSGRLSDTILDHPEVVAAIDIGSARIPHWCLVHRDGTMSEIDNGVQSARRLNALPRQTVREFRLATSPSTSHSTLVSAMKTATDR